MFFILLSTRRDYLRFWCLVPTVPYFAPKLPFEHSGDSETIYLGHYLYLRLPQDLMHAVRRLAREVGTSAYFILLSSFLILLNRLTGMKRPIVGFVSDARIHPDADGVIGNFVNSVPLMHAFDDDDRLINAICDCVKSASDGIAHAGIPVATLLDIEGEDAASIGGRFASASFNQVPDTFDTFRLGSLPIEPLRRSYIWRKNTIVVLVSDKDDGSANVQFSYPTELMSESRARVFLNHFRILLQTVVEEPECRLADIINPFGKPPSSDEEKKVISLFEEVLGRPVRRDESFFESGGDSLSALRLLQKIKAVLRVPLTYAEIFEDASRCDLAAHLKETGRRPSDEGENILPSVERLDRNHRWPATDNQKVYWRLITEGKGKVTGNIVRPMRVRGRLKCTLLRKALKIVIDRHEALRTGLVTDDKGDVVQRIVTRFRVPIVF